MQDFKRLDVWTRAHALTVDLYRLTGQFPRSERYALASQLRRGAASLGANIAEGAARSSRHEFGHFLNIAIGSAAELEYHTLLAHDLGFIDDEAYTKVQTEAIEIRRMLISLRAKVLGRGSVPPP